MKYLTVFLLGIIAAGLTVYLVTRYDLYYRYRKNNMPISQRIDLKFYTCTPFNKTRVYRGYDSIQNQFIYVSEQEYAGSTLVIDRN